MADRKSSQRKAQKRKDREERLRQGKARKRAGQEVAQRVPIEKIAEMPIVECLINFDWKESGRAQILVARRSGEGELLVGGFLVDTWCRGLQDTALLTGLSPEDYETRVKPNLFVEPAEFVRFDPSRARGLVEGAIAYAEPLGFRPNKRWPESRRVFAGVKAGDVELVFGREGRVCLRIKAGENSRGARARLDRTVGPEGYTVLLEESSVE